MKLTPEPFIFKSSLNGYIAMWATRQSPYLAPDGLTDVLKEFQIRATAKLEDMKRRIRIMSGKTLFDHPDIIPATREALLELLESSLLSIPQVRQWNERKNGNQAPYGFCSRYDKPDPDDDFIDLDAMVGNIVRSCLKEDRENREDFIASTRWTLRGFIRSMRYRFSSPKCPMPST